MFYYMNKPTSPHYMAYSEKNTNCNHHFDVLSFVSWIPGFLGFLNSVIETWILISQIEKNNYVGNWQQEFNLQHRPSNSTIDIKIACERDFYVLRSHMDSTRFEPFNLSQKFRNHCQLLAIIVLVQVVLRLWLREIGWLEQCSIKMISKI